MKKLSIIGILAVLVLFSSNGYAEDNSVKVLTALAQCQSEFKELTDIGPIITATDVVEAKVQYRNSDREKIVRVVQISSYSNGSPLTGEASKKVATLTMRGDIYDSHSMCESTSCTYYTCEIEKH